MHGMHGMSFLNEVYHICTSSGLLEFGMGRSGICMHACMHAYGALLGVVLDLGRGLYVI